MYISSQIGPLNISPLGGVLTFGISPQRTWFQDEHRCFGKNFSMGDTVTLKKKSKKKKKRPDHDTAVTCDDFKNTDENDCAREKPRKKKKSKQYLSDSGVALETENDIDNSTETFKKKRKKKRKHEPDMADRDGSDSISGDEIKPKKKKSKKSKRKEDNEDGYQLELSIPTQKKKKRNKQKETEIVTEQMDEITQSSKEKCKRDKSVKVDHMESGEGTVNDANAIKKKKKKKKQKRDEDEETPVEDSRCEEIQTKKKKKKKKQKQEEENINQDDSIEKTSTIKNSEKHNTSSSNSSSLNGEASKEKPISYNCQPFDYGSGDKSGGDNPSNTSGPYLGQWGTACLGDNDRQHKFMRLLGGFKKGGNLGQSKPGLFCKLGSKSAPSNAALNHAEEAVLNKNLESDFDKALAIRLSKQKTSGLGFAPPPEEGKRFYIDKTSSKSIKFDDSD
ncbi:lysine-rich nucleolar protein 1-like [Haliotis asinina]|uniref:lysine-rich nucleolar protein 1-like n=1 Tax=Haliotis asinina TaxID=109174 RepID=UPI003531FE77